MIKSAKNLVGGDVMIEVIVGLIHFAAVGIFIGAIALGALAWIAP